MIAQNKDLLNKDLSSLREEAETLNLRVQIAEMRSFLPAFEQAAKQVLRESHLEEGFQDFVDRREYMYDDMNFDGMRFGYGGLHLSTITDREEGKYVPVYENETDIAIIRGMGQVFASAFPSGMNILESLTNYTLGKGFDYEVVAAPGQQDVPKELVAAAQRVIDEFLQVNDWKNNFDREIHKRSREEGEALLWLHKDGWRTKVEMLEPACLTEPQNQRDLELYLNIAEEFRSCWKFGVHTKYRRTWEPLGYHFTFNGEGSDWEYVNSSDLIHIKRNVPRNAKRGVSDFFPVRKSLELANKVLENSGEGSAVQASIAWIVQHAKGVQQSDISKLVSGAATRTQTVNEPQGNKTLYQRNLRGARAIHVPQGQEYVAGPLGAGQTVPAYTAIEQALLRYAGVRWQMPEYLISGDASNSNFASALIAESPFVKGRESDQEFEVTWNKKLLWKVLKNAVNAGFFYHFGIEKVEELDLLIDLKIEPPDIATKDKSIETANNQILWSSGLMSPQTWAAKEGLDYEEEVKLGAKPLGMPDASGMGGGASMMGGPQMPQMPGAPGGSPATPGVTGASVGGAGGSKLYASRFSEQFSEQFSEEESLLIPLLEGSVTSKRDNLSNKQLKAFKSIPGWMDDPAPNKGRNADGTFKDQDGGGKAKFSTKKPPKRRNISRDQLRQSVQRLNSGQRKILNLVYKDGNTIDQAARQLGKTKPAAQQQLRGAMKTLHDKTLSPPKSAARGQADDDLADALLSRVAELDEKIRQKEGGKVQGKEVRLQNLKMFQPQTGEELAGRVQMTGDSLEREDETGSPVIDPKTAPPVRWDPKSRKDLRYMLPYDYDTLQKVSREDKGKMRKLTRQGYTIINPDKFLQGKDPEFAKVKRDRSIFPKPLPQFGPGPDPVSIIQGDDDRKPKKERAVFYTSGPRKGQPVLDDQGKVKTTKGRVRRTMTFPAGKKQPVPRGTFVKGGRLNKEPPRGKHFQRRPPPKAARKTEWPKGERKPAFVPNVIGDNEQSLRADVVERLPKYFSPEISIPEVVGALTNADVKFYPARDPEGMPAKKKGKNVAIEVTGKDYRAKSTLRRSGHGLELENDVWLSTKGRETDAMMVAVADQAAAAKKHGVKQIVQRTPFKHEMDALKSMGFEVENQKEVDDYDVSAKMVLDTSNKQAVEKARREGNRLRRKLEKEGNVFESLRKFTRARCEPFTFHRRLWEEKGFKCGPRKKKKKK